MAPLDEYHRKRDFATTPEPAGDAEPTGPGDTTPLSFVIHKHAARSLHYDVRLELDGVLLSWAVPKGPSLDTADKRLAVHVEDHPLEYGTFEGMIPPGEYGAGAVIVWDRGSWRPLVEPHEGLQRGNLKFQLAGEKLHGSFALVRMKPRPGERGENWLLIKERDGDARTRGEYDVLTRGGEEWSERMPALARAAAALPVRSALLDGEAVVFGQDGTPDFGALQSALSEQRDDRITYLAFDLLYLDGRDLRAEPLVRRKNLLADLLERAGGSRIRYAEHVAGDGAEFLAASCSLALEGAVSKRADAPYRPGRTAEWRKTKCRARQEFVVGGFTGPRGSRTGFGSLLLGYYDTAGTLHFAGRVGSGLSERDLLALHTRLASRVVPEPPFADPPRITSRTVQWVRPELVVEIEFAEWTARGVLRQPDTATGRPRPRLTNPDKALFEPGPSGAPPITKAALAAYYESVAPAMLPHVADRPLSIVRCPHGDAGACFFQKHPDARSFPLELHVIEIAERTGPAKYFSVGDVDGLLALVQLGVVEIHAWNSHVATPVTPDRIVFDLDPGPGVKWPDVVAAASTVRDALAALSLTAFVKTTGGHGLHVVTPIVPDHGYDTVRGLARGVVDQLVEAAPGRFTARMAKTARPGKVFIDYLRNARGATAIAAYSTRTRPGAPVAVPVTWEELHGGLDPAAFDTVSVPLRLTGTPGHDPWEGYDDARTALEPAMFEVISAPLQEQLGGKDTRG
ncbi:MAG: ATP-dependent DNA ligase [Coriobacteriia bacterium]|nr:ATP-dependent DNA ligase [Coriobacteriia bacterium]